MGPFRHPAYLAQLDFPLVSFFVSIHALARVPTCPASLSIFAACIFKISPGLYHRHPSRFIYGELQMSAARRHRKQVFGLRRRRDLYMLDPQDRASCVLSSTLARCSLSISCFSPHPPAPSFRMAQFVSFSSFVLVLFRSLPVLPVLPVVCPCNPASFTFPLTRPACDMPSRARAGVPRSSSRHTPGQSDGRPSALSWLRPAHLGKACHIRDCLTHSSHRSHLSSSLARNRSALLRCSMLYFTEVFAPLASG